MQHLPGRVNYGEDSAEHVFRKFIPYNRMYTKVYPEQLLRPEGLFSNRIYYDFPKTEFL